MKISSSSIYKFFRKELPALTKATSASVVVLGVLAFVIFSPGFTFKKVDQNHGIARIGVGSGSVDAGVFKDSEPLFLPTVRNFGAGKTPDELKLQETSFLPFGSLAAQTSANTAMNFKYKLEPPAVEDALGLEAWGIARNFGAGEMNLPHVAGDAESTIRVINAETGECVFSGVLVGVSGDDAQILLAPAEFIGGVASGYGRPQIATVSSCGSAALDKQISARASSLLTALNLNRGIYRILVELR